MKLRMYDPKGLHWREWHDKSGSVQEFAAVVQDLEKVEIKICEWETVIFRNPMPHEVTAITKGDRLAFIAFIGNAS